MSVLATIQAVRNQLNTDIVTNGNEDIDAVLMNKNLIDFLDTVEARLVASFEGRVGAVSAATNDYTWAQIDKTISDIADLASRSHTDLTQIGTKTHAQLDSQVDANNAKVSNVSTDLTTTQTTTTVDVVSSDGTDATLPQAIAGGNAGVLSGADKTKLDATSGTNTGDQTAIADFTGTKAQFDTACTDGNFLYDGDSIPVADITGLDQNAITQEINAQVGTTYTLVDADHGKLVTLDNASAIALSVNTGLRSDFACTILQKGAGVVTIGGTATVNEFDGYTDTAGQWALASISHLGSDVFISQGRLA
jgi:hypothetical protein